MVDPQQEIDRYLQASEQFKVRITHIIETHIQADHLSGCRDLAAKTGASIYLHEAAKASFDFHPVRDGDGLELGNVQIRVLHTPGHSLDSICLLVTDKTRGPDPWLLLTGDTLFVGDAGRPDLHGPEEARRLAEALYESLFTKLLPLNDALAIYPTHFAGSACGRTMSGNPSSTLGFERRFNPASSLAPRRSSSGSCWRTSRPSLQSSPPSGGRTRGLLEPLHLLRDHLNHAAREIRLGLWENLGQFALLVLINVFVGMMVGLERTVVPLIGEQEFGLASKTAIVSFIVSFGVTKALCNLFAARISETWGRKRVLLLGWLIGLPVPFLIIFADRWVWFNVANVLLGVNQALCWSMTVIMKVDLVGPARRGLALGLNECAGYLAVGFTAWITGYIASISTLRPHPFYLGIGVAIAGLLLSWLFVDETLGHARLEAQLHPRSAASGGPAPSFREIFLRTSWRERALFACSQAGLVNNLNDGMSWGIYPLFFASFGLGVAPIGMIKAVYPATWGVLQVLTGTLSDRIGRKGLIAGGMAVQAVGIWLTVFTREYAWWLTGAALQGLGTAMVYPTLLAAISDVAHPSWRATAMGVYRLWRDLGYAIGALLAGVIADLLGMAAAIHAVAALTLLSGMIAVLWMHETLPPK